MHPYVHRSTIHKVKIQKQLKCPSTDEWIRCGTYILMEYFLAIKKNEMKPFAETQMHLEIISEVTQKEKDRYYTISLIHVI